MQQNMAELQRKMLQHKLQQQQRQSEEDARWLRTEMHNMVSKSV